MIDINIPGIVYYYSVYSNSPCKIYFDILTLILKDETKYSKDSLTYGIYETIKDMIKTNYDIELQYRDFIICERQRDEKCSYHIIIRNYYVERKKELKNM